ncbi:MAG: hypothetical protein L6Q95_08915 [Planctomycetes bacterium]|nr:hypothetical protein [Planctomycetota bacterium]
MRTAWVVLALAGTAAAQEIGEPAPAIAADGWLNVPAGEAPSLDAFRGKAVLIEFWDTG